MSSDADHVLKGVDAWQGGRGEARLGGGGGVPDALDGSGGPHVLNSDGAWQGGRGEARLGGGSVVPDALDGSGSPHLLNGGDAPPGGGGAAPHSDGSVAPRAFDGSGGRTGGSGDAPHVAGSGAPHLLSSGEAPLAAADGGAPHVLDNPALASLTGPHAHFAEKRGRVLRYPVDVSPWLALPDEPDAGDWADLAALAGPGAEVPLTAYAGPVPEGWEITFHVEGVQLVDDGIAAAPDPEAVRLGPADVPEMLDLIARTQPGPFLPRTVEMGTYLGIRREGALVAMAGERLHPPGWTEISAVCTDPSVRGQGLATRLILAVAHGIREGGETPFLHTGARNTNAIRLYESLGFRLRRRTAFLAARVPERTPEAVS